MPLTLRGEHGEQAHETDEFVEALRERVTVPVETYDERFTSVARRRRRREGRRAPALELPRVVERRPRHASTARCGVGRRSRRRSRSRPRGCSGGRDEERSAAAAAAAAAAAEAAPDHLPGGLHAPRDGGAHHGRRRDRAAKRHVTPKLSARAYLAATRGRCAFRASAREAATRASSSRRRTTSSSDTTSKQLVRDQLETFSENWAKVDLRYARKKNLTPYDVLIIASMVEKEAQAPRERPLVAAVIYNRLHSRMPLGIDATIRYGLDVPPTESLARVAARQSDNPYNTRMPAGPAADADREPGARLDPGRRASGEGRLPLLRAQAGPRASLLHGELRASSRTTPTRMAISARDAARRAARPSRRALALAAHAERGVRGARARLGVRRARRPAGAARGGGARARGRSASPART